MTTQQSDPPAHLGCCTCGAEVRNDGFRDRVSYLEFRITGNCQECQDRMFLATRVSDPTQRFALRHGTVAAHDAHLDEYCLLPFVCTAEPRLVWDAHRILRIGARLQPLDPHEALEPMAAALNDHAVRVHESATVHAPALPGRLACADLVIVLDHSTHETLKRLPLPIGCRIIVLADEGDWSAHYATSLCALERAWGADPERHRSLLRTCALVGWTLAHVPDGAADGARPIDAMLRTASVDD